MKKHTILLLIFLATINFIPAWGMKNKIIESLQPPTLDKHNQLVRGALQIQTPSQEFVDYMDNIDNVNVLREFFFRKHKEKFIKCGTNTFDVPENFFEQCEAYKTEIRFCNNANTDEELKTVGPNFWDITYLIKKNFPEATKEDLENFIKLVSEKIPPADIGNNKTLFGVCKLADLFAKNNMQNKCSNVLIEKILGPPKAKLVKKIQINKRVFPLSKKIFIEHNLELATVLRSFEDGKTLHSCGQSARKVFFLDEKHFISFHDTTEKAIKVWNIENGKKIKDIQILDGKEEQLVDLRIIDRDNILVGSNHGQIYLWNLADGKCIRSFCAKTNLYGVELKKICILPDKKTFLSFHNGRSIHWKKWNLENGELIQTWQELGRCPNSFTKLETIINGEPRKTFTIEPKANGWCSFPGMKILSRHFDKNNVLTFYKLWDRLKGKCLRTLDAPKKDKISRYDKLFSLPCGKRFCIVPNTCKQRCIELYEIPPNYNLTLNQVELIYNLYKNKKDKELANLNTIEKKTFEELPQLIQKEILKNGWTKLTTEGETSGPGQNQE